MSETSAFFSAVAELAVDFDFDRRAARRAFPAALALATPADREFLDDMVDTFTLHPYKTARRRLEAKWGRDEAGQQRLEWLLPDTDPGLYIRDRADRVAVLEQRARRNRTTLDDEAEHAPLPAAELPRQSMRLWRNPPGRTYLAPSHTTDKARLRPEQIRARVHARGKRRPAETEPALVADYIDDGLFVDTAARDLADARATEERLRENGLLPTPARSGWMPRFPGDTPPADADEARQMWDCEFVGYVAEQHQHAAALAGNKPVSQDTALAIADRRTTLNGDRRRDPLTDSDEFDYDGEAMTPVSGWRCVSCFVERPTADQRTVHARYGRVRSDDGLCDYCRADDRRGLPELPAGFTARDLAHAYCQHLADTYPAAARAILAEARRRAPRWLAELIVTFLDTSGLPGGPADDTAPDAGQVKSAASAPRRREAPIGAGQRRARCEGCTRIRAIHDDGFCTECRVWLGLIDTPPRQHTAA